MRSLIVWGLVALWVLWIVPVFMLRARSQNSRPARTANVSLIGMLMQAAAYPIVFTSFGPPPTFWRAPIAVIFGLASLLLMWTAIPALGKHWRLAAGVYEDHELVQSGPYGVVRHPIYASMLALLLATGLVLAPWFRLAIAVVIFCVGTLIRIQSEEKLLAERFGDQFAEYRKRVRAIIPWLW